MGFLGSSTPKMRLRPGLPLRPGPRWGAYSAPKPPGWWEGGSLAPPKNPTLALGPSGLELRSFGPSVPIVPILRNDHCSVALLIVNIE